MLTTIGRSTIQVHFWNLAAYTSGRLIGDWIDLDELVDLDHFRAAVHRVVQGAEEILLSTSECDYGIDLPEFASLEKVWELHETLQDLHDEDERQAFADYLSHIGGLGSFDEALSDWRDRWCGRWDSIEEYAWDFAENVYPDLANVPPGFRVEVDTTAWECDHWISASGHVFRSF